MGILSGGALPETPDIFGEIEALAIVYKDGIHRVNVLEYDSKKLLQEKQTIGLRT